MTSQPTEASAASTDAAARVRTARRRRTLRKLGLGLLGILGFLLTWQLIPTLGIINPRDLPTATTTFERLGQMVIDLEFWRNVGRTLTSWAIGLTIAIVLATVLGAVVGMVPVLRRATHTTVEFLRPIPSVALIPLAILLFGIQRPAALLIIVYASFWQLFVQVLYGVADIDAVAHDTAKSFRLPRRHRIRFLVIPTTLPYFITGLRLAAAVALILTVTAEMAIGVPGLGNLINIARNAAESPSIYAIVVVTGLLGLLINTVFRFIERRALAWHQSVRGEDAP